MAESVDNVLEELMADVDKEFGGMGNDPSGDENLMKELGIEMPPMVDLDDIDSGLPENAGDEDIDAQLKTLGWSDGAGMAKPGSNDSGGEDSLDDWSPAELKQRAIWAKRNGDAPKALQLLRMAKMKKELASPGKNDNLKGASTRKAQEKLEPKPKEPTSNKYKVGSNRAPSVDQGPAAKTKPVPMAKSLSANLSSSSSNSKVAAIDAALVSLMQSLKKLAQDRTTLARQLLPIDRQASKLLIDQAKAQREMLDIVSRHREQHPSSDFFPFDVSVKKGHTAITVAYVAPDLMEDELEVTFARIEGTGNTAGARYLLEKLGVVKKNGNSGANIGKCPPLAINFCFPYPKEECTTGSTAFVQPVLLDPERSVAADDDAVDNNSSNNSSSSGSGSGSGGGKGKNTGKGTGKPAKGKGTTGVGSGSAAATSASGVVCDSGKMSVEEVLRHDIRADFKHRLLLKLKRSRGTTMYFSRKRMECSVEVVRRVSGLLYSTTKVVGQCAIPVEGILTKADTTIRMPLRFYPDKDKDKDKDKGSASGSSSSSSSKLIRLDGLEAVVRLRVRSPLRDEDRREYKLDDIHITPKQPKAGPSGGPSGGAAAKESDPTPSATTAAASAANSGKDEVMDKDEDKDEEDDDPLACKLTELERSDPFSVDLIVSNNVLEQMIQECIATTEAAFAGDAGSGGAGAEDELDYTLLPRLQLKLDALVHSVQSGALSLEDYLQQLRERVERDQIMAVYFKRKGTNANANAKAKGKGKGRGKGGKAGSEHLAAAVKIMKRIKAMKEEIESADQLED